MQAWQGSIWPASHRTGFGAAGGITRLHCGREAKGRGLTGCLNPTKESSEDSLNPTEHTGDATKCYENIQNESGDKFRP